MKARIMAMGALVALMAALVGGCGEDLTEKVQGVWKTAETREQNRGGISITMRRNLEFIEITREKLRIDDEREYDVALDEKDGKVALRRAGTDEVLGVVGVIDEDTLEFSLMGLGVSQRLQFKRSSREELDALYNPPLDKIVGIWRTESEGGDLAESWFIEIAADSVSVGGTKTAGAFATKKGVYVFMHAEGGGIEEYSFNADGKLIRSYRLGSQAFVPSAAEESAAAAKAKRAALEKHFGFWRKTERVEAIDEPYGFIEISESAVDIDGRTAAVTPVYSGQGSVEWLRKSDGEAILSTRLVDGERLQTGRGGGYFGGGSTYERSDRETVEKLNSPKIEHFVGYWLPEPSDGEGSFRCVEIGPDYIVRDNRREPIQVTGTTVNIIALGVVRVQARNMFLARLSHMDGDRMGMNYNLYDRASSFAYRRVDKSEYDAVAAKIVDPFTVFPGFWRSEQPVKAERGRDQMVYATAAFALDVRGENGKAVDWSSLHYLSSYSRISRPRVGEGIFVIRGGLPSNPVEFKEPNDTYTGSGIQIRVIGPDVLEIARDGREYVRCVRSTEEEVRKFSAQITALY